ncbi:Lipase EstA/Esterase EstB family-containing protein [Strongyloides ratti]|uniref:Lipase EstA/Esterase EstB family-containing protein n=1 Tax=Strongyloides ratti TaxID=34506 RepID=A0A090LK04_STRRB|nr:Lipase EstA/Esterase EstB family-containing protein [Strongyloides ratti]CEF70122.1 Lipase EstA/Esterase EstB family-containing protein [Strongyloides ratti]
MKNVFIKIFLEILLVIPIILSSITGPFTENFQNFLKENGYDQFNFTRNDLGNTGSYGGKENEMSKIKNLPIIFIHGNSDSALSIGTPYQTGWSSSIEYFLSKNYTSGELYAITWGNRNIMDTSTRVHDCETISRIRRFIEAVKIYTQKPKVNVIAHSMGVTLSRGAIIGVDACPYKSTISGIVDTFIGISGANYGLCSCSDLNSYYFPTCSKVNGFWPGDFTGTCLTCETHSLPLNCNTNEIPYSEYLENLNNLGRKPSSSVYSMWSLDDEIIKNNDYVGGKSTSHIVESIDIILNGLSHIESKDNTPEIQYNLINKIQFKQ